MAPITKKSPAPKKVMGLEGLQTNSKSMGSKKAQTNTKKTSSDKKMKDSEFHKFFIDELKDIYWAEKHLSKALPKLQKAATTDELSKAFEKHTQETGAHIKTLEKVFELLGEKAVGKKCDAMEGLLEEANSIIADTTKSTMLRDAGLILAAQKVEHYEIATYGTLRTFAEKMGHQEVTALLEQTLKNEKETDVALTKIAVKHINEKASEE